ncbi:MAG: type 1 glutamine amidotransferase domain-containing protein [Rhodobacteraceae bacterium]|nr:type 1 glutamine amidotransferase domain-containing protein [Paracoccaceae bacterium]
MPRVLMIVANPATSPVTGWPIGFWWAELSHAWLAFSEAGYEITVASPAGGDLLADAWSDPEHESGYSARDIVSLGFKRAPHTARLIEGTPALAGLDADGFDALFVVGGQAPMVNMVEDAALHALVARHFEAGRITAAVCHGTCILLKARLSTGDLLVKGRTWTGFANSEERHAEHAAGMRLQPFWIEDEARKLADTNFVTASAFARFAVRDGNLITGQQQNSSGAAAALVIEALGRRG